MSGFTTPGDIYRYDSRASNKWSLYRNTKVPGLNLQNFTSEQVSCHCDLSGLFVRVCRFGIPVRMVLKYQCLLSGTKTHPLTGQPLFCNTVIRVYWKFFKCLIRYDFRLRRLRYIYWTNIQFSQFDSNAVLWLYLCCTKHSVYR